MCFGGGIVYFYGLPPLLKAESWDKTPSCDNIMLCVPKRIGFAYKDENGIPKEVIEGTVMVRANYTFTVDRYSSYEFDMKADGKKYTNLIFVFIANDENFMDIEKQDPQITIRDAEIDGRLVGNKIENDRFYAKVIWQYSEPSTISLLGFAVDDKEHVVYPLGKSSSIVTLSPQSELIETKRNLETEKTNLIILALTWMGIGLAPILLGADFIIRVILKE